MRAGHRTLAIRTVCLAAWACAVGSASAQYPDAIERTARLHGFGWGDGYHVCREEGARWCADLPPADSPHKATVRDHWSAAQHAAHRVGATFYDHFNALNRHLHHDAAAVPASVYPGRQRRAGHNGLIRPNGHPHSVACDMLPGHGPTPAELPPSSVVTPSDASRQPAEREPIPAPLPEKDPATDQRSPPRETEQRPKTPPRTFLNVPEVEPPQSLSLTTPAIGEAVVPPLPPISPAPIVGEGLRRLDTTQPAARRPASGTQAASPGVSPRVKFDRHSVDRQLRRGQPHNGETSPGETNLAPPQPGSTRAQPTFHPVRLPEVTTTDAMTPGQQSGDAIQLSPDLLRRLRQLGRASGKHDSTASIGPPQASSLHQVDEPATAAPRSSSVQRPQRIAASDAGLLPRTAAPPRRVTAPRLELSDVSPSSQHVITQPEATRRR